MENATIRGEPLLDDKKRGGIRDLTGLGYSQSKLGFLTKKQFQVLLLHSFGYSQQEVASELQLSRSSVSMIETRARRQIEKGRQTLKIFQEITKRTRHVVVIERGTNLQRIPMIVLLAADKYHVHMQKNMIEILRMVKSRKADCLVSGKIIKKIKFIFNERGKLTMI